MPGESRLQPIAPDQLLDLLTRLGDEQTTDLALIGPDVWLHASPEDWPEVLQGRVLYRLTGELSGLPRQLLRLDRLQTLILWRLGLREKDAAAIAEQLGQLTSLNLSNSILTKGKGNDIGDEAVADIGQQLTGLVTLILAGNKRITTVAPLVNLPLSRLVIVQTGVADLSPLSSRVLGSDGTCLGQDRASMWRTVR